MAKALTSYLRSMERRLRRDWIIVLTFRQLPVAIRLLYGRCRIACYINCFPRPHFICAVAQLIARMRVIHTDQWIRQFGIVQFFYKKMTV